MMYQLSVRGKKYKILEKYEDSDHIYEVMIDKHVYEMGIDDDAPLDNWFAIDGEYKIGPCEGALEDEFGKKIGEAACDCPVEYLAMAVARYENADVRLYHDGEKIFNANTGQYS